MGAQRFQNRNGLLVPATARGGVVTDADRAAIAELETAVQQVLRERKATTEHALAACGKVLFTQMRDEIEHNLLTIAQAMNIINAWSSLASDTIRTPLNRGS